MKLIPKDFVATYLPFALKTQKKTGISAVAILAQAALESGWGDKAPGNMFFGIKAKPSAPASRRQLVITTEYLSSPSLGKLFPEVLSITQVGPKRWKYKVKDWFRKYKTPEGSFNDHAQLFLNNSRYAQALKVGADPVAFFREIAKAGYATAPSYFEVLTQVAKTIERFLPAPDAAAPRGVVAPPPEEMVLELTEEELRALVPTWPRRRGARHSG